MEGKFARAFIRRRPDVFEHIKKGIRYPIPLGRTGATHVDAECALRTVLFASTLHHLDFLRDTNKSSIFPNALNEAINLAVRNRCSTLATAVMMGG